MALAKSHLRVLHDDDDELIGEYISTARARCEAITGLTLTIDDEVELPQGIGPTIKQAIRLLVGGYYADREGNEMKKQAEDAVQNLLFNARLMIHELPDQ